MLGRRTYDDLFAVDGGEARFAVSDGVAAIVLEFEAGYPYAQIFAPPGSARHLLRAHDGAGRRLRWHDGLVCVDPGLEPDRGIRAPRRAPAG